MKIKKVVIGFILFVAIVGALSWNFSSRLKETTLNEAFFEKYVQTYGPFLSADITINGARKILDNQWVQDFASNLGRISGTLVPKANGTINPNVSITINLYGPNGKPYYSFHGVHENFLYIYTVNGLQFTDNNNLFYTNTDMVNFLNQY